MSELKFIITGTPGVGKSTAIQCVSDTPAVSTDLTTTDDLSLEKDTTTVAMDYGEIFLGDDEVVHIYGTPGQERFRFMWDILAKGGLGLIILVDNSREDPLYDMAIYLDNFEKFIEETGAVVGITRFQEGRGPSIDDYNDFLQKRGQLMPVLEVDIRQRDDVLLLLDVLFSVLEME